jgi:hypothetical protein
MRHYLWPTILCFILWLLMTAVLPVWLDVRYVPNLLLAGILVLAVTDISFKWFLWAVLAGFILDLESSLLFGSYALILPLIYMVARGLFLRLVPADRIYIALPATYVGASAVLALWVSVYGILARQIGWPIEPIPAYTGFGVWLVSVVVGAALTLIVYTIWLEILHRVDRPLRLRR